MRFLLANNHCITDPTAGVTQSLRTIMEWLSEAGHACHVLTTARFESPVTFTIEEHLIGRGVSRAELQGSGGPSHGRSRTRRAKRPVVSYAAGAVPVMLLLTRCNDEQRPDRDEAGQ